MQKHLTQPKKISKKKMKSMGLKEGFDIGLEMSGSEAALDQMVDAMIMGGKSCFT